MEKIKDLKPKIVTKVSVTETLLSIPIGKTVSIRPQVAKGETVRKLICKLKKKGNDFIYTTKGRIEDCLVTRLK
jgi:hypothetical protein